MNINKKNCLMLFSFFIISQLSFGEILENDKKINDTVNPIKVKHDFTKAKEEAEKNKKAGLGKFVHIHSSKEALAKTGIIYDFNTEADDNKKHILKNKEVEIEDGVVEISGNPWNYPTGKREVIIEDSKITLENNNKFVKYQPVSSSTSMEEDYYPNIPNGEKQKLEDIKKEKYRESVPDERNSFDIYNAGLKLKNSEIIMKGNQENGIKVENFYATNTSSKTKDFLGAKTFLHIIRDKEKLATDKYDICSNYIVIMGDMHKLFSFDSYDKDSISKWYKNRYSKDKGTPLFLLGKNAKIKTGNFYVNMQEFFNMNAFLSMPELMGVTANPKEDEMVVFEKGSEAEFKKFSSKQSNIKFKGGKIKIKADKEKDTDRIVWDQGIVMNLDRSQTMGEAIFDLSGLSIVRRAVTDAEEIAINKNTYFTDLKFLPKSKLDVSYIKDGIYDFIGEGVQPKDSTLKAGTFKLTFENDTQTYLGYSARKNYETIKNNPSSDIAKDIKVKHASDADMIFNSGSSLSLFREKHKDSLLEKDGDWEFDNDKQGNLIEFTGVLTLNDSKVNYRTNIKDKLSDKIVALKPILGKGATLKLENQGDTSLNGKEELILIKANKGTSSKTKFNLENDKLSLGGKDYKLFERLGDDGKEFYLATKDKENFDSLVGDKSLAVKETEKTLNANDKNSFENSEGAAVAVKDEKLKFDNVKNTKIKGKYAIHSNNGSISGNGVFDIDGNIYHKGDKGFDLTLEKGSILNSSILDISGDTNTSKLHFKNGSKMYVNNYSNTNMIFDKGSELHLYKKENEDKKLTLTNQGNKVVFTEPINLEETNIYFRTNIDDELSDTLKLLGELSGTSAKLYLKNRAESDILSGAKIINLVEATTPNNFKWKLGNQLEIGGYTYDMKLNKKENSDGKDIIYAEIGNANKRKAKLSSTAQTIVENTKADYFTYNSINDSIFDSLYSNITTEKNDAIWAKYAHDNFETKEYGMKNQLNTILVGVSKDLNQEKTLTGGFFAGNYNNSKKINKISASGSLKGFVGGAYLSYRGYLGFGDFIAAYGAGDSEYTVLDSASNIVENKQNSKYIGAGLRFGKQFFLNNSENFYVEPSAKITYGRINGQNTTATNGLKTNVEAIKSWTTGAYTKLGYKNNLSFGKINSYAKLGVTQEILGKYKVGLNEKGREEINLDNNTINYGIGVKCDIGNNSVSFDFDLKNSPTLKNYYKFSLGYQYKF